MNSADDPDGRRYRLMLANMRLLPSLLPVSTLHPAKRPGVHESGQGDPGQDPRPLPGGGLDRQAAADRLHAVAHVAQPVAVVAEHGFRIEPRTVIADGD